jgi:hypothetical protein
MLTFMRRLWCTLRNHRIAAGSNPQLIFIIAANTHFRRIWFARSVKKSCGKRNSLFGQCAEHPGSNRELFLCERERFCRPKARSFHLPRRMSRPGNTTVGLVWSSSRITGNGKSWCGGRRSDGPLARSQAGFCRATCRFRAAQSGVQRWKSLSHNLNPSWSA